MVLVVRGPLTLAMSGGWRRNRDAFDHQPHVVLDVRMIQVQLQQRRGPVLALFEVGDLECLDIDQLIVLVDIERRRVASWIEGCGPHRGRACNTSEGGDYRQ